MIEIKMAVFDMAGTTVNEYLMVYKTLHLVLENNGYSFDFNRVMHISAGKEKKAALREIFQDLDVSEEDLDRVYLEFSDRLNVLYGNLKVVEQEGASFIFNYLRTKGVKVVLNTGYDSKSAAKLLELLGWKIGVHIDDLITADMVLEGRPAPDMILLAMQRNQILDSRFVAKIGDTSYDILEGKAAGLEFNFGILTGAHQEEHFTEVGAYAILSHLNQLTDYI